jgi:5S rRNA maturation endonuclease (ribonuclease M5)
MNIPLRKTLDALDVVRENGNGWEAKCPAHDDSTPSLSVTEKTSGEVLLNCFAGCDAEAVLDAAGLEWADLYPDDGNGAATATPQEPAEPDAEGVPREDVKAWNSALLRGEKGAQREARAYLTEARGLRLHTLRAHVVGLRHLHGQWWICFPVVKGGRVERVKRVAFDPAAGAWAGEGKKIRTDGGGSGLYWTADLQSASGPLLVCEGELDAMHARQHGYAAVTGTAGAGTFRAEWAREIAEVEPEGVVVCFDGDEAGRENAPEVARKLDAEGVTASVAELPDGKDVNDLLQAEGGKERLRKIIADATPPTGEDAEPPPASAESEADDWQPFPVEALPGPVAGYVRASAAAVGCAEAMVALPVLSSLSAAAGSAARLRLKRTWRAPATLWTMVVAPSGSAKSPAMKQALRPVHRREREAKEEFERTFADWKARSGDAPEEDRPERTRYRTGDATPESIMKLLGENPRGLLLARNELGAWLGSFDRYAQGAADLQFWMEVWDAMQASRDRAGDGNVTVDNPAVPITGTIQPGALKDKLTPVHFESGFAARFLLANPPTEPLTWTEADVTRETEAEFEEVLDGLYALPQGTEVRLSGEAKRQWIRFYNRANQEAHDFETGAARAVAMKATRYGARLALLVHLGRRAAGETSADEVDSESMTRGLMLARWLRRETLRVHDRLNLVKSSRPPVMRFFNMLPAGSFETEDAKAVADRLDVPRRTRYDWMKRLVERGLLEKIRRGHYCKP